MRMPSVLKPEEFQWIGIPPELATSRNQRSLHVVHFDGGNAFPLSSKLSVGFFFSRNGGLSPF